MKKKAVSAVLAAVLSMSMMAGCADATATGNTGSTGTQDGSTAAAPATDAGETGTTDAGSADAGTTDTSAASGSLTGTLKLGMIGPLTGGAAIYGNAVKNGEQIAVDEINAISGDFQIEYNPQDDEHDAEKSVNAYHNLQDWGVQVIAGTVTTTPCVAVSAEANADRIFMLTPSASSPTVTEGKDNMFQLCFSDPNQGSASAQYISDNKMASKVAVIYNNSDAYSTGIYQTFNTKASELGLEIVSTTTFTDDTANDFSVQLADAKDKGAELVFLPIYYQPASLILTQAAGMGYEPIFFGVDGMDGILGVENFDTTLAEGVVLLTPFTASAQDEMTVNFVTKYKELHNDEEPNQFAADAYDGLYILKTAIEHANVTPDMAVDEIGEALKTAMTEIEVDGLTGSGMTWGEDGAPDKDPKAVVIQDGVYVGMEE